MRYLKFLVIPLVLVFVACGDSKNASVESKCEIKAFGAMPPLTALLEIIAPDSMIGLNYKPYPEDVPFMPERVSKLPVLGLSGNNSMLFEEIAKLKPSVIFFATGTLDSAIEPYEKLGITAVKVPAFDYDKFNEVIDAYASALGSDKICGDNIKLKASALKDFVNETNAMLENLNAKIESRQSVYFAQGLDGLKTQCGEENDKNDLAYKIGGKNAISCSMLGNAARYSGIDIELLAKVNPSVIFVRELDLYKQLRDNPPSTWANLSAIAQKRVYYAPSTPSNWLMRPPSIMQNIGFVWAFSKVAPNVLDENTAKAHAQKFFELFLKPLSDEDYIKIQALN